MGAQALQTLAALVIVIAGMRMGSAVLAPILLALFFALALSPLTERLKRAGASSSLAIGLALLLSAAFLLGLIWIVGDSTSQLREALPRYEERLSGIQGELVQWLTGLGVTVPQSVSEFELQPQRLLGFVSGLIDGLGGVLSNSIVVVTVMLFALLEAQAFPARLGRRRESFATALSGVERITVAVVDYLSVKTVISLATGVTWGVFLAFVGVDFPVLWGLLAFLLNYVPNIGSPLAAIPPILLALVQFGWGKAFVCVGGTVAVNTLFGSILEPKMMGQKLGLSTLVIFIGLVFWAWVFGPIGTILSVPLTLVVKMSMQWTDDYRELSLLLGPTTEEELEGPAARGST